MCHLRQHGPQPRLDRARIHPCRREIASFGIDETSLQVKQPCGTQERELVCRLPGGQRFQRRLRLGVQAHQAFERELAQHAQGRIGRQTLRTQRGQGDAQGVAGGRPGGQQWQLLGVTALQALHEIVVPGGLALLGPGYWKQSPDPEYLAAWREQFHRTFDGLATDIVARCDLPGKTEVAAVPLTTHRGAPVLRSYAFTLADPAATTCLPPGALLHLLIVSAIN